MDNFTFTLIIAAISFIGGFTFGVVIQRDYMLKKLKNAERDLQIFIEHNKDEKI